MVFKAQRECEIELARANQLEAEVLEAERELSQQEALSKEMDELERRYWDDFNDYHLQLQVSYSDQSMNILWHGDPTPRTMSERLILIISDCDFIK